MLLNRARHPVRILAALACLTTLLASCSDANTGPQPTAGVVRPGSPVSDRSSLPDPAETTARWNRLALQLVALHEVAPPKAARIYAYLSVAQDRAANLLTDDDDRDRSPGNWATHTAINEASAQILRHLFVTELAFTADELTIAGEAAKLHLRGGDDTGPTSAGARIADALIARARTDRADATWTGSVPVGPGLWLGTAPQLPAWGQLRPWLMRSADQFRAPAPPAFGSARFLADLAEVRRVSDSRSAEQLRIATFWADGAGTSTPPGHWNEIATTLAAEHHLNERKTAHALALMDMAISDAVVGCWDSKYTYWVIRPYQADPQITTPIGKPPHPSYPSGHACSSNAAAGVLAYLFPRDAERVLAMATESGLSRIYGGIHYRFDIEAGRTLGRSVAAVAVRADLQGGRKGEDR